MAGNPIQVLNAGNANLCGSFGIVVPTPSPSGSPTGTPTGAPTRAQPNADRYSNRNAYRNTHGITFAQPDRLAEFRQPVRWPHGRNDRERRAAQRLCRVRSAQQPHRARSTHPPGIAAERFEPARYGKRCRVGTMFLESDGEARLRLRSDDGDHVPVITHGATIRVNSGP